MMHVNILRILLAIAAPLVLAFAGASPAAAQSCSFGVNNVAFGSVDTLSGAAADTTATVSITCGGSLFGTRARLCLNINAGTGGSSGGTRLMRNSLNQPLAFQLYQDAARSVSWGSVEQSQFGQPVAVDLTLPILFGSVSTTRTIYGRVLPGQQGAATGSYSSLFSGSQVRFNYAFYGTTPPACTAVTGNTVRPSFTASATVSANCLVSAQDIDFGTTGALTSAVDSTGNIAARCTPGTPFSIGLNGGLANGTPTQRLMTLGSSSIQYGLYRNSARTQAWGDNVNNRATGLGTGLQQNVTVYGRVPPQATPPPGTYSDTVVATIRY